MSDTPENTEPEATEPEATEPAEAPAAVEEPAEVDELRSGLLATLEAELGDGIVDSHVKAGTGLWVRVALDAWVAAAEAAKGPLGCEWFDFLSAIDWLPSPFGRYEVATVDTAESLADKVAKAHAAERPSGYAGGDTRFQLLLHVVNTAAHHDVFLKADVPDDSLAAPTISHLYAGANWHEREAAEMFGIHFEGHPWLANLYLPGQFEGFPLRKDFPLLARAVKPWPGLVDKEPIHGEDEEEEAAAPA